MFGIFTKDFNQNRSEKKSYYNSSSYYISNNNTFSFTQNSSEFIQYYLQASPVFTAIKLVADNLASIPFVIQDKKNGEFIRDDQKYSQLLDLLDNPNPFTRGALFKKSLASFFLLSGNSYINVIGNNKPVELQIFRPQEMNVQSNNKDGYAATYNYNSNIGSVTYSRDDKNRFVAPNGNELGHLINFNPQYSSNNLYGVSDLMACELEINQYIQANIHNNALLNNQATPSGILTHKGEGPLDDTVLNDIKELVRDELTGSANAGRPTFLGGDIQWTQMSESIRDMDFAGLETRMEQVVYKAFKIPLTFATEEASTMNNKEIAKLDLYDNAVIPVFNTIASFLTHLLMPRYTDDKNIILTYDPASIPALEPRRMNQLERRAKINIETINELRGLLGREELPEGGNDVRQPANLVPVGVDGFTDDNRETPAKKKSMDRANFIKTMKDGGYDKKTINQALKDHY
jgi:HK97 family phage portal protein